LKDFFGAPLKDSERRRRQLALAARRFGFEITRPRVNGREPKMKCFKACMNPGCANDAVQIGEPHTECVLQLHRRDSFFVLFEVTTDP
jgi:hypothetical protein